MLEATVKALAAQQSTAVGSAGSAPSAPQAHAAPGAKPPLPKLPDNPLDRWLPETDCQFW